MIERYNEMITITPTSKSNVTKLACPDCKEYVRGVGIEKGSTINGLILTCKRCKRDWSVVTK
jgi:hypothetical protein